MKVAIALVGLLFAAAAFGQASPVAATAACGPDISFKVKLDDSQHTPAQPDAGKAQVYFLQDAGTGTFAYPVVKTAIDGAWVGANHGSSYFSVSVEPGEHHVCVMVQSSLVHQRVELAHFTAEADRIYYYRTRLIVAGTLELLELNLIDSDQGKYLVASFPLSLSSLKK